MSSEFVFTWSLHHHSLKTISFICQIFSCVSAVLKTDESAEVRRASVLVITLLLKGLGKNIMEVSFQF